MPSPTRSGYGATRCRSPPTACLPRWKSGGAPAMEARVKQTTRSHDRCHDRCSVDRVPGAAQRGTKCSGALQTRDRYGLWRSRISGAPLCAAPRPGHSLMDALPEFALIRATTLEEMIGVRARHPDSRLLGGGTDLVVNIRRGILAPPVLIDVNDVTELR